MVIRFKCEISFMLHWCWSEGREWCHQSKKTWIFVIHQKTSFTFSSTLTFTWVSPGSDKSQDLSKFFHLGFPNINKHFHILLCNLTNRMSCQCSSSMYNLPREGNIYRACIVSFGRKLKTSSINWLRVLCLSLDRLLLPKKLL